LHTAPVLPRPHGRLDWNVRYLADGIDSGLRMRAPARLTPLLKPDRSENRN